MGIEEEVMQASLQEQAPGGGAMARGGPLVEYKIEAPIEGGCTILETKFDRYSTSHDSLG